MAASGCGGQPSAAGRDEHTMENTQKIRPKFLDLTASKVQEVAAMLNVSVRTVERIVRRLKDLYG